MGHPVLLLPSRVTERKSMQILLLPPVGKVVLPFFRILHGSLFRVCVCTPEITHLYKQGRWTHAAIPLGPTGAAKKRFLHIISFYNISGRDQGVLRTNRNRFLECIFTRAAGLGQQPVMICTDANTSVSSSHCLSFAVATGQWIDLGSHFTNNSPEPTFGPFKTWDKYSWTKNVSRPDYIFVNQAALSSCKSFKLRRDLSPRGHLGIEVVIQTNCLCQVYRTINVPKAFPQTLRLTQEEQDKLVDAIPFKKIADFQAAKNSDPNLAWKIFASIYVLPIELLESKVKGADTVPSALTK